MLPVTCSSQTALAGLRALPRPTVERRLHAMVLPNGRREKTLKALFMEAGCGATLSEQAVRGRAVPNLLCTLPGLTGSRILVGAHLDHARRGSGAVDNWSGSSLLPSLFESLSARTLRHTFIFIAFTSEERGLAGSKFYVGHLDAPQLDRTRALINVDSLGLGPTKVWATHSDGKLVQALNSVAARLGESVEVVNADRAAHDDSEPFIQRRVPTVVLHSVTPSTFGILHSHRDELAVVRFDDYYESYRLILAYLAYLDQKLP